MAQKLSKKEVKKIPAKNYIIVLIMFILTVAIVLGLRAWYRSYHDYKLTIPVISGKVNEITINEFNDYVTEHDNFILYIGTASNETCRNIEKDLVNVLNKRNVRGSTIYLNMSGEKDISNRLSDILAKYGYPQKKQVEIPTLIIFNDRKINAYTQDTGNKLTIYSIEKLLDEYEIGE